MRGRSVKVDRVEHQKSGKGKEFGVLSQGMLIRILVSKEQPMRKNTPLFINRAMKFEATRTASEEGMVANIHLAEGELVNADDLVVTLA